MNKLRQSIENNSWIELVMRWILGLTFIYASFHKIISPEEFARIVYGYDLFPEMLINLIAIVLPFLELIAGAALIIGFYPRAAAIIINALLLVFITILAVNLIRGHEFDCGCFSAEQKGFAGSSNVTLVRDVFYFIFGMQVVLFKGNRRGAFGRLNAGSWFK